MDHPTHILNTEQFTKAGLEQLFKQTDAIEKLVIEKGGDDRLKHRVVASLFYEPSTRTSSSFIAATERLCGAVIVVLGTDLLHRRYYYESIAANRRDRNVSRSEPESGLFPSGPLRAIRANGIT